MDSGEKRTLIESYIRAYNTFDVEGMVALVHPDCLFRNVSGGQVNATTSGIAEFRDLANTSKALFSSRHQEITGYQEHGDVVSVDIAYEAVLSADLLVTHVEEHRINQDTLVYPVTFFSIASTLLFLALIPARKPRRIREGRPVTAVVGQSATGPCPHSAQRVA